MKEERAKHFETVRYENTKWIRNLLREFGPMGKAELSKKAGLSIPTVAAILDYLLQKEEVKVSAQPISNGGRPGEVFQLKPDFQYALCGCIQGYRFNVRIHDAVGGLVTTFTKEMDSETSMEELGDFLSEIKESYACIRTIVLGIPGIVNKGQILHLPYLPQLEGVDVAHYLEERLHAEVFVENDINAIAYAERSKWQHFAHVFIEQGCIGVAIVLEGHLIRGAHGAAGELECVCGVRDEMLSYLARSIAIITSVIDVPDIALSGECISEIDLVQLNECIEQMILTKPPRLHKVNGENELYQKGLWLRVLESWKEQV